MKKYIIIFDDTNPKSEVIQDVIGDKGFADIVIKRKKVELYYSDIVKKAFPNCEWHTVKSVFEFNDMQKAVDKFFSDDVHVMHCFSNFIISDKEKAIHTFGKLEFIDNDYKLISEQKICGLMFASA